MKAVFIGTMKGKTLCYSVTKGPRSRLRAILKLVTLQRITSNPKDCWKPMSEVQINNTADFDAQLASVLSAIDTEVVIVSAGNKSHFYDSRPGFPVGFSLAGYF